MTIFAIQLFNFILFLFLAYVLFMPALRGYFYSRRLKIRKDMTAAAINLKKSKEHLSRSKADMDGLEVDVGITRNDIESSGKRECDEIMKNAKKERAHILAYIRTQMEYYERKSGRDVGERLVDAGFEKARGRFVSGLSQEARGEILKAGLVGIEEKFGATL